MKLHIWSVLLLACLHLSAQSSAVPATSVPIILPGGLAYDAEGNLYFAETGANVIREVALDGTMTIVAGTGVQGFAGDGGPATAADLDSPQAIAFDSAGDLLIADTHNHRIRRVDASSGTISTVVGGPQIGLPTALASDPAGNMFFADAANHRIFRRDALSGAITAAAGNGVQGFSGDGGPATAASIDSPCGVALDNSGNLYFSDTHNHRVRRVDHTSGIISSVAGTGQQGFGGDGVAAGSAPLRLPRGLAVDQQGNLFLVDSGNHRLRRVDSATGTITTVAGDGTQAFAGDGSAALAASLDSPRGVALSAAGLATLSDTHNERVRQVDASQTIATVAGLGKPSTATLTLAVPASFSYGGGQATATLTGSAATGSVAFFDTPAGASVPQSLGSATLSGNVATLALGSLSAGAHRLSAAYTGDASHPALQSAVVAISIAAAPAIATPTGGSMAYGAAVPALNGTLTGILPQDSQAVSLVLKTTASAVSPPGSYLVQASLSGSAAANYVLTSAAAAVVVAKAPPVVTLSPALAAHVASPTSGAPLGQISLLDGATMVQTASLNPSGDAAFSLASLSGGSHTLRAAYAGDTDFLPATSAPLLLSTGSGAAPDFSLSSSGAAAVTVPAGSSAAFQFTASPTGGALNSPIQLSASGLPVGATATFNPSYLPPSASASGFTLTVQTAPAVAQIERSPNGKSLVAFAGMFGWPMLLLLRRRPVRMRLLCALLALTGLGLLGGCGSRTNSSAATASAQVYTITVTGTATADSGATLQHTASVKLSVQ